MKTYILTPFLHLNLRQSNICISSVHQSSSWVFEFQGPLQVENVSRRAWGNTTRHRGCRPYLPTAALRSCHPLWSTLTPQTWGWGFRRIFWKVLIKKPCKATKNLPHVKSWMKLEISLHKHVVNWNKPSFRSTIRIMQVEIRTEIRVQIPLVSASQKGLMITTI